MRFPIARQLAILATTIALVMTLFLSLFFLSSGRAILIDHEVVDLGDECNLQAHEVQDDLRYLGRELRSFASQLSTQKYADGQELIESPEFIAAWESGFANLVSLDESKATRDRPLGQLAGTIFLEARILKFDEDGSLVPALALRQVDGTVKKASPQDPSPAQLAFTDLQTTIEADLKANGATRAGAVKQYQSRLLRGYTKSGEKSFYASASGYPLLLEDGKPAGMLLLAIDFTELIHGRFRYAPRQYLFAVDSEGQFLAHPDSRLTGTTVRNELDPATQRTRWQFGGLTWGAKGQQAEDEYEVIDRNQGTGLSEVALPELQCWFAKKDLSPQFAIKQREQLNRELEAKAKEDSTFRFSKVYESSPTIAISCADRGRLKSTKQLIDEQERKAHVAVAPWQNDVKCTHFAAHFAPLHMQLGKHNQSPGLIFAASREELASDIDAAVIEIGLWALIVCFGAGGMALLAALFLTKPLGRINEAAQHLAEGDYSVELPVDAHGEVGELARTFQQMVKQIRDRDTNLRDNFLRLDTILSTAAEGIITFDEHGTIEQCNHAAETMFGYGSQELAGAKVQQLLELPQANSSRAPFAEEVTDGTLAMIKNAFDHPADVRRGLRKDGTSFWLEASFRDVPLGNCQLVAGVFRDVTRRKEDEERIKQMNEKLEARVKLRTAELEDAKSKLELALHAAQDASLAKDEFVRTVSHELRTPLSAVLGFAELLLNPRATKLRENPQPKIQKIHTAGKHLLTLINDLLDVARYTSGQTITLTIAEFELPPFVQGVVEMVTPLLKKNSNQLRLEMADSLRTMRADETRIRQILLNLLGNACKFTEKGVITFSVSREENHESTWIIFSIADTGVGMTSEQMARLFKPFYRVDNSTSRRQGGTGLGLSITKLLCEQMGGSVDVQSELDHGSVFTVRLPVHTPSEAVEQTEDSRNSATPMRRPTTNGLPPLQHDAVLIVDDNAMIRELMESFLKREDFRVYSAATGEDGIRMARELRPGSITLDVGMPGMDGWAVLAALKNDAHTHDIPVIMVTIAEDRSRGFSLGAADYLTKPIDWNRLHQTLQRYCRPPAEVLVVDDDPLVREQFRETLSLDGWTVREASNGREALERVNDVKPAIILLDLMMPLMDGFEFLRELRQRPHFADIQIVIVTAKELTNDDRERLNGGVSQILSKGALTSEELLGRLRSQLGSLNVSGKIAKI